jgi:hypothetical protein
VLEPGAGHARDPASAPTARIRREETTPDELAGRPHRVRATVLEGFGEGLRVERSVELDVLSEDRELKEGEVDLKVPLVSLSRAEGCCEQTAVEVVFELYAL